MIRLKTLLPHLFEQSDPTIERIVVKSTDNIKGIMGKVKAAVETGKAVAFVSDFVAAFPDNVAKPKAASLNDIESLLDIFSQLAEDGQLKNPQIIITGTASDTLSSRWIPGMLSTKGNTPKDGMKFDEDSQLLVDRSIGDIYYPNKTKSTYKYIKKLPIEDEGEVQQYSPENLKKMNSWSAKYGKQGNLNLAANRAGMLASEVRAKIQIADDLFKVDVKTSGDEKSVTLEILAVYIKDPTILDVIDLSTAIKWNTATFTKGAVNRSGVPSQSELDRAIGNKQAGQFNVGSLQFQKDAKKAGFDLSVLDGLPKGWVNIDDALINRLIKFFKVNTKEDVYKIISQSSSTS